MKKSLGLIETEGLAAGVEAADAAVKSANVQLIGYELTKGGGWTTVKIEGDVGAVKAAVDAAKMAAAKVNRVVSTRVIPRPSAGLDVLVHNPDTVGDDSKQTDAPKPPTPPDRPGNAEEMQNQPADTQEGPDNHPDQAPGPQASEKNTEAEKPDDAKPGQTPEAAKEGSGEADSDASVSDTSDSDTLDSGTSVSDAAGQDGVKTPAGDFHTTVPDDAKTEEQDEAAAGREQASEPEPASDSDTEKTPAAPKPARRTAKGRKGKRSSKQEAAE